MAIRRASQNDIQALSELLRQVCNVHHQGRPDLFKQDGTQCQSLKGNQELFFLL